MWKTFLLLSVGSAAGQDWQGNFTVYSAPIKLRYGEVYNNQQGPLKLPGHIVSRYAGDKEMAITGFDVEMVRIRPEGGEDLVKLNDHYLHHYILSMGRIETMNKVLQHAAEDKMFARMLGNCHGMTRAPMHNFLTSAGDNEDLVTFGSAAGAEYRHNPQRYDKPFRRVIKKPQVWMPTFHVINTKSNKPQNKSLPYSPLLECPCTPQRKIDVAAGTIDGQPPEPPIQCSPSFAATGNPSCNLSTYVGGWRCCEHGVFLIDTDKECSDPECSKEPEDEIFMKYTFYYDQSLAHRTAGVQGVHLGGPLEGLPWMAGRDGFQPCLMDTGAPVPTPNWERHLVIVTLAVHVMDVGLDLCVAVLFVAHAQWIFFLGAAGVIFWAWLVSSLYISFGGGAPAGDIDNDGMAERPSFLLNFAQVQIFAEVYRCIFYNGDTDYFHTLRLMEAILESAPNSLVQLYALVIWAVPGGILLENAASLLRLSVFCSFVSVGLGLAMWEQKVQFRTSSGYVAAVAIMRAFEIAARSATLAVFSGLTHPYGFFWSLAADYCIMLFLIVRHQSVQFTYGLCVALPLVLVSVEPLVWRREDHAVPKDSYYLVRVAEFVVMWTVIIHKQVATAEQEEASETSVLGCEALALFSMLGLFVTLPFVWRIARQHELCRDVADWSEEGAKEAMNNDALYSESDGSSGEFDRGHGDNDELPPE